ncbi:MazG family protein [Candidatus Acetothermia bacterium]|jgi:MazG family protein|nr:MazG family protein [Candidatus Acetothermia bacterium]MCI2427324.1 MazG family protein [Candidatus Acetothermia bacterium]MCI2428497.1 MazG family protein [Candidatus Acetothermia bacterium]
MSLFNELTFLIAKLRSPAGCPWDRRQDHLSLRPYIVEEAYEAVAAIDAGDMKGLASELGDLLLQILLHAQIATENGEFTLDDLLADLKEKVIRRHPHVFAHRNRELKAVKANWEKIKQQEKRSIHAMPALLAARKLLDRAANLGIELDLEIGATEEQRAGLIILHAIKEAHNADIDPELALRNVIAKLSQLMNSLPSAHKT